MISLFDRILAKEWSALAAAIIAGTIGLALTSPAFLTEFNVYVMLRSFCVVLVVAFAQMLTLAVGQLNLSIGALGGLVAVLVGGMMEKLGLPIPVAILAGLLVGAAGGLANGLLTVRTGINGFIITLATASAFTGINLGITESVPFYDMPAAFVAFGSARFSAFPYLLIPPVIVALALGLFLARTIPGRQLLAVGGNPHAAELSGIPKDRIVVLAHTLSGLLSAVGAILAVAQLGSAQPTIGADWLLMSFAAPIIGGAALTGGHISVASTALAVVLIVLIQNGMVLAKVDPYWVQFMLGALILAAVGLNRARALRAERS
ncbi:ABC transporter permease [Kaistia geumhonensis]|uniref:Ribose transport system permease protein n=1 Tax=Kaistia geumhonensis TaxID=410839 RepID=A0ABU0MAU9_9HYPH|nr:ABC transporter permease [Kaistia geumhonensis]MCX5481031.1 ABC transporter permease [Kaistia geumhonensis]MDQ0518090.1 ribose transport system permease protein [Kaistia geumhonensis]